MAPIDFTNDQNTMREVSEASLTDQISKYASRITLETSGTWWVKACIYQERNI